MLVLVDGCVGCGDDSGGAAVAALLWASRRSKKAWFTLQNQN